MGQEKLPESHIEILRHSSLCFPDKINQQLQISMLKISIASSFTNYLKKHKETRIKLHFHYLRFKVLPDNNK